MKKSTIISGPARSGNTLSSFGIAHTEFEKDEVMFICGRQKPFDRPFYFQDYTSKTKCIIIDDLRKPEWIYEFFMFIGRPFEIEKMNYGKLMAESMFIINTNVELTEEMLNDEAFKRRFVVLDRYRL